MERKFELTFPAVDADSLLQRSAGENYKSMK